MRLTRTYRAPFAWVVTLACFLLLITHAPVLGQAITVSEGIYLGWAPFYIADAQKLWEKEGLTVTAVPFTSGRLALDAIVGGRAAVGTVAETPVVFAALNGIPVRVIGHMNIHDDAFSLVATKSIKGVGDIRGRKIGYLQGTNGHFFFHRMLQGANLKFSDITPISMNPPDMVTALAKGDIDAFVWGEPHVSQAIALGKGNIHEIKIPGLYQGYASIVTLQSVIDSQPQVLVKALRALISAVEVIRKQPEEAVAIAAAKTKMDPAIAKKVWLEIRYGIELSPGLVPEMEAQARWAIGSGFVRPGVTLPDFSKVVVARLLAEAKKKQ